MLRALLAAGLAATAVLGPSAAFAQQRQIPSVTVTPLGPNRYFGLYGRDLPGVYMLEELPVSPTVPLKHAPINTNELLPARQTYHNPLPWLDAWHGNYSPPQIVF